MFKLKGELRMLKKNDFMEGIKLALNEKVEVISNSNEDLYGMVGVIKDIKESSFGTELRLECSDGFETWIDAEDVQLYSL